MRKLTPADHQCALYKILNPLSTTNTLIAVGGKTMHLEEMKKEIETLVKEKGFYNKPEDISKKLLFAFIELGEASDAWKKGETEEKIAEELIDVIFYVLDASRLACPSVNMDETFRKKMRKNRSREYQYGEGHRHKPA